MALIDKLSMHGYAFYVWSAYGVTLFLLSAYAISQVRARNKVKTHAS